MPAPAHLLDMEEKDEGKAPGLVNNEEERRIEGIHNIVRGLEGLDMKEVRV